MRYPMQIRLVLLCTSALLLTGCITSTPANVPGVSLAIGSSLPGSMGKTLKDQDNIDSTVARGCGSGVYTPASCRVHTEASAKRRKELQEN